jgi:hypothetical protein
MHLFSTLEKLEIQWGSTRALYRLQRKILHNIHTDVGKPMKLVRLIKMYLHETYNTVQ